MKPLIGIIMRKSISESGKQIEVIYKDIIKAIINSGGIPVGINNQNIKIYQNICNGYILQGGDDLDEDNLKALKILKNSDVPILGICLGMQEMAYLYEGEIYEIANHQNSELHPVIINKESILMKILNEQVIAVNSRHTCTIKNPKLFVGAKSLDNIVESVEDKRHIFFLGLQWHPENMYDFDINSRKIFDYFVNLCHDCEK